MRIGNPHQQQLCKTQHTFLELKGFTTRPLGKESLLGNEFSITIYDAKHFEMSEFKKEVEKVANFYGLQRFGSERLVTHLVGREIVKKLQGAELQGHTLQL
jgi:tRNA pseudouridine13 synthase